jgi:hypothetical protein
LLLVTASTHSQDKVTPLDEYIDNAETIVIGRCTHVGAPNILLRARVNLIVLLVVKGEPTLKEMTLEVRYGMKVGQRYLVRLPKTKDADTKFVDASESVIAVSAHESIDKLRALPPRIVVLRTINQRIDRLENNIRINTFELEALKSVKKGN